MRDCIGGAADADGPEHGDAPLGRTRQERERPPGAPGLVRSGGRCVGSAGGSTVGARGSQVSRQTGSGGCRQRTRLGAGNCAGLDVSSAGGPWGGTEPPSAPEGPGALTLHPPAEMSPSVVSARRRARQARRGAAAPVLPQPSGHPQGPCVPSMAPSAGGRCRDGAVGGHFLGVEDSLWWVLWVPNPSWAWTTAVPAAPAGTVRMDGDGGQKGRGCTRAPHASPVTGGVSSPEVPARLGQCGVVLVPISRSAGSSQPATARLSPVTCTATAWLLLQPGKAWHSVAWQGSPHQARQATGWGQRTQVCRRRAPACWWSSVPG